MLVVGLTGSIGIAPFLDTCSFLDPFITGIHIFQQVIVCYHVLWNIHTDSGDLCTWHDNQFIWQFSKYVENETISIDVLCMNYSSQ